MLLFLVILLLGDALAWEEQFYNDYFMTLPPSPSSGGRRIFVNAADFQTKIVAYYNWKAGEARPQPPLVEAIGICEQPLDVLLPVINDCPGLVMSAFRFCADFNKDRFGHLKEVNEGLFAQLSQLQQDIVRQGWLLDSP